MCMPRFVYTSSVNGRSSRPLVTLNNVAMNTGKQKAKRTKRKNPTLPQWRKEICCLLQLLASVEVILHTIIY